MPYTTLADLTVSRIGLGTMGMSAFYTGAGSDDAESIRTIHRALDLGVTLFDTAEAYGPFTNEELLGRALKAHRDRAVIATIPGTKHVARLEENLAADELVLTAEQLTTLDNLIPAAGEHHGAEQMKLLDR